MAWWSEWYLKGGQGFLEEACPERAPESLKAVVWVWEGTAEDGECSPSELGAGGGCWLQIVPAPTPLLASWALKCRP